MFTQRMPIGACDPTSIHVFRYGRPGTCTRRRSSGRGRCHGCNYCTQKTRKNTTDTSFSSFAPHTTPRRVLCTPLCRVLFRGHSHRMLGGARNPMLSPMHVVRYYNWDRGTVDSPARSQVVRQVERIGLMSTGKKQYSTVRLATSRSFRTVSDLPPHTHIPHLSTAPHTPHDMALLFEVPMRGVDADTWYAWCCDCAVSVLCLSIRGMHADWCNPMPCPVHVCSRKVLSLSLTLSLSFSHSLFLGSTGWSWHPPPPPHRPGLATHDFVLGMKVTPP